MTEAEVEAHLGDTAPAPEAAAPAAAPAKAAATRADAEAPAAPAPPPDTPAGVWRALGIQDEHTEMGILSRQQALITENAITCIGRNLMGQKKEATKIKSELKQTVQVVSVHTIDIAELKGKADDDSKLNELMAEIAAVKKQTFEVRRHAAASAASALRRRCFLPLRTHPRAVQPPRAGSRRARPSCRRLTACRCVCVPQQDNHRLQTQLTQTRSDLAQAQEELGKLATLPEICSSLVSQVRRLEARFDMLPPPFDPNEIWKEMHGLANVVHESEHAIHVLESKTAEVRMLLHRRNDLPLSLSPDIL